MIVSMSTSGTDIKTQLKFIRDNMISSETPLTILTDNFIKSIQTYGDFVDRTIYDWVGSLNYTPLTIGDADDFLCPINTAPIHGDVTFNNTTTAVIAFGTTIGGTVVPPLKDLLNCLHITLEVLHEPNLIKYKMKNNDESSIAGAFTLTYYDAIYGTVTGYDNIKDSVEKILPNIAKLDKATSNIEVIKRVLKGFIMLIESYLNLTKNHLSNCIQNENVAFLTQNGSINPTFDSLQFIEEHRKSRHLHQKVSNYETKYDKGIKTIDEQEKYIDDINSRLKYQSGNVKNNSRNLIKNSVFHYIYLSLFVVFVITLMLIATTKDDSANKDKSKIVVGTIFGISVVSFIIFYSINNSIFESFAVIKRTEANNIIELEFVKYLENTINLGILVDTNMRYSDIVYKLEKEVNENDNKGTQLKLEKESLKDKQTHDYRTSKILRARIMLLLQILILLSATVFVNLMVSGIDVYLAVVFTIVFIFIVYLYIIKASRYVNTDARKIYWQKPSDKMLR